jgi:nucleoside-diphosphate-sugar epimerase
METLKILITGASGFVGSHLVEEALSRGLDTYAGIRPSSSKEYLQDQRIKFCHIDFSDTKNIVATLNKYQFDYIIHNAGLTRANDNASYFKVNVDYTIRLAEACLQVDHPIKKFTFISSIEAYGSADSTPEDVVNEDITPSPRTTYGLSKRRAEDRLMTFNSLPWMIMRPTAVFGPREKDFFELFKTIKKFKISPTVGSPNIKYTFIYVKDLARVVLDGTLSQHVHKGYFLGDGRIHKMKEFSGNIAKALNIRTLNLTIPLAAIRVAVGVTGIIDRFRSSKSLLNDEQLAKMEAENWDCDISPAVSDFNFQPKYSLESAINETVRWYQEQGWL